MKCLSTRSQSGEADELPVLVYCPAEVHISQVEPGTHLSLQALWHAHVCRICSCAACTWRPSKPTVPTQATPWDCRIVCQAIDGHWMRTQPSAWSRPILPQLRMQIVEASLGGTAIWARRLATCWFASVELCTVSGKKCQILNVSQETWVRLKHAAAPTCRGYMAHA